MGACTPGRTGPATPVGEAHHGSTESMPDLAVSKTVS